MKQTNFYLAIASRIIIIILLSILGSYVFLVYGTILLEIGIFALLIISVFNLIYYFNKTNRWISFFLSGIENEDTSLRIPSKTGNKSIEEIFIGMKRLNDLFKETKIRITTQEHHLRRLINQSATGLFSVNQKDRIVYINPRASKLLDIYEYQHINSLAKINKILPDFIKKAGDNTKSQSAVFTNKYGQTLLFKLSIFNANGEKNILIALSDITKELDNREVEAWVKLARTLSHEIMNNITPITTLSQVILGYFTKSNMLQMDEKTIQNTIKGLRVIEERSLGLMNFVQHYRKFTKLPEPQYSTVNVSALLERNLTAISIYPDINNIEIRKEISTDVLFQTDENLLSQVILNLLKNAYEALIQDSNISNPTLKIRLNRQEHTVRIEIANNGPRIDEELREKIFIPFFTTKEDGTGIGLSLSKQILFQMNGEIVLKQEESYTKFVIHLFKE